jgi:hypothetical protein
MVPTYDGRELGIGSSVFNLTQMRISRKWPKVLPYCSKSALTTVTGLLP